MCRALPPEEFGFPIDPFSLVRLPDDVVEHGRLNDGRQFVRTEVIWVDHFGNMQLALTAGHAAAE